MTIRQLAILGAQITAFIGMGLSIYQMWGVPLGSQAWFGWMIVNLILATYAGVMEVLWELRYRRDD